MPRPAGVRAVLAITSNKGGVGKTSLATNLAIYLRALREDLPVALVGLDDQRVIDRMFALRPPRPGDGNLKHGWAERCLDRVLQIGEYGVHFVPSPPDVSLLKARAEDPHTLRRILERTAWNGIFVLDTKSDLEALTRNALHAADRVLIPVADWASLEQAGRSFSLLERARLPLDRARVVFTLVDRRSRMNGVAGVESVLHRLEEEVRRRGWPRYRTTISRSPRVESLSSGTSKPLSILHHARGTAVHRELHALAGELLRDFEELTTWEPERGGAAVLWGRRLGAPEPGGHAAASDRPRLRGRREAEGNREEEER
jgi:cellulose biosynthesis protein BcsQ